MPAEVAQSDACRVRAAHAVRTGPGEVAAKQQVYARIPDVAGRERGTESEY